MGDPVPAEQMTDSVCARRLPVGNHDHLAKVRNIPAGPFLYELRDCAMEELVAFDPRLEDVVVDVADRHGRENCAGSAAMSPGTPLDEEHARGVGMQFPRLGQHLDSLPLREHVVDEHERNLLATGMGAFQNPHRVGSDEFPAHAEVAAETALKLRLDPVEPGRIYVNRQQ